MPKARLLFNANNSSGEAKRNFGMRGFFRSPFLLSPLVSATNPSRSRIQRSAPLVSMPVARPTKSSTSPDSPLAKSFHLRPLSYTENEGFFSSRNGEHTHLPGSPSN